MGKNQNNDKDKRKLSITAKYFLGLSIIFIVVFIFFLIAIFSYNASLKNIEYDNILLLLDGIKDEFGNQLSFESTVTLENYTNLLNEKLALENTINEYDKNSVFNNVLDKMQAQYDNFTSSLSNLLIFVSAIIAIVPILLSIFNYVFNKDLLNNLQNQMSEYKKLASDAKKYSQIFSLFTEANAEKELSEKIKILSKIISIDENNQSAYNNRGNVYLENKEYSNAVNDYTSAIEINKKDDKEDIDKMYSEYYNRAHAYYLNKNYKNAIGDYNLLINRNPTKTLICERARVKFDDKDYDGAIEDYSMVINNNPELAYPYINRGKVYIRLENYDRAIDDFKKATKLDPCKSSYNILGFTYFLKKSFDEAIDCFTEAIKSKNEGSLSELKKSEVIFVPINLSLLDEKSEKFHKILWGKKDDSVNYELTFKDFSESYEFSSPLINRANAYRASGRYEKAIEDYTKAIESNLEIADYYDNRGRSFGNMKKYKKAIVDFSKAIELSPENSVYYYNRGIAYGLNKNYEKAIENYTEAIKLNPENSVYYYNRGKSFGNMKKYKKAIVDFSKAIELSPENSVYYNNCGITYENMKKYEKAIEDYTKAIELNPENAFYYNNRGRTYGLNRDYKKAIVDFSKAIELNPENVGYYNNRGITYENMKEYEKAIEDYTRAIEMDPKNVFYYNNRGNVYFYKKEYEKAIDDYTKVIDLDPKDAVYYNNRGNAYFNKKEYESAEKDYNKAVELGPSFNSYNFRANLYRKMGENAKDDKNRENLYNKALADGKKAIEIDPDFSYAYGTLAEIYASMGNDREFYKNLDIALSKDYPLMEVLENEPDIKELYDKYKDQEKFKALMKKYNIDYK